MDRVCQELLNPDLARSLAPGALVLFPGIVIGGPGAGAFVTVVVVAGKESHASTQAPVWPLGRLQWPSVPA